jgi:hypothetical protein
MTPSLFLLDSPTYPQTNVAVWVKAKALCNQFLGKVVQECAKVGPYYQNSLAHGDQSAECIKRQFYLK